QAPSYTASGSTVQTPATEALATAIMNAPTVDRSNFYGSNNDYEDVKADMVTVKLEHDLDAKTVIGNTSRYGKTHMDRVATGFSSPSVSANSINPTNAAYLDPNNLDAWVLTPSRQRIDRSEERRVGKDWR